MSRNHFSAPDAPSCSRRPQRAATTAAAAALLVLMGPGVPSYAVGSVGQGVSADEINKSIVWVDVEHTGVVTTAWPDGSTTEDQVQVVMFCTGWFVSDEGHVATAGHCLEEGDHIGQAMVDRLLDGTGYTAQDLQAMGVELGYSIDATRALVGQPSGIEGGPLSGDEAMVAQVVGFQGFEDGDNALLKIANITDTPALEVAEGRPEIGEEVTAIGFPGSVSAVTETRRQGSSYKGGAVSSLGVSRNGVPVVEIDAAVSEGMSGGPTVDADGAVIGVNSFKLSGESQPFNFVTDTDTMRTFLEGYGVELAAEPAPVPAPGPVVHEPGPDPRNEGLFSIRTLLIAGAAVTAGVGLKMVAPMLRSGLPRRRHSAP